VTAWAILAAAGEGSRLGAGPKAFVPLGGTPMLAHALVVLAKAPAIEGIVVVVGEAHVERARGAASAAVPGATVEVVPGGATRSESVACGLAAVPLTAQSILVHDAARPLVSVALVSAALEALSAAAAAVVAVPERDTLKRAEDGRVLETLPRRGVWRAQTPQAFRAGILRRAHEQLAVSDRIEVTDDAVLVERLGETVVVVPGDERNLKVTTPADLALAEALLGAQWGRA
jgi:2-C-methyl-D-erythritol 4-phosphate cytidylyltransferase